MKLTEKQREVWRLSISDPKRWNISVGAVRSGKTRLDHFRIPYRIMHADKGGAVALIGCTEATLERNLLAPMRQLYSKEMVGRIKDGGSVRLFGRDCFAFGASRRDCADKLQGMSISYCCGDEITTWDESVFKMLQSRLDRKSSVFDGSCNPSYPSHWFKRFIDSMEGSGDIRVSTFTIDDNTFLPPGFVSALKKEYEGTVYYDRFILGLWKCAEGSIYPMFADDPQKFILPAVDPDSIIAADIGVDFGGNGSATAFNLTGYTAGYEKIITLDEYYRKEIISPGELERDFIAFASKAKAKYPRLCDVYCDSAEQVLIRGLDNAVRRNALPLILHNARKGEINQRIRFYCMMFGSGRYFILPHCTNTIRAFSEAVWEKDGDRRLDNGSVNIDSLDAQEYSTERRMNEIIC